jgi:glucose-1-phosphate adenylyltransferase
VGAKAHVKKAIIDRGVKIDPDDRIGFDLDKDRERFFVSESGLIVIAHPSRNLMV